MFCGPYYDVQALAAYAESGRPLSEEQKKCLRDAGSTYGHGSAKEFSYARSGDQAFC